jgi:rhodanese-related sulfurtransferase
VHLDENFFEDSMEALRLVAQELAFLSLLPPISDSAEKVVVELPVQDSASVVVYVKDMVKSPSPARGFLQQGFINLSPIVQVNLLNKVSIVSTPTLV